MRGRQRIAAPVKAVWEALHDPETLRRCIPNCRELERTANNRMAATVFFGLGPAKVSFHAEVTLDDVDPPHRCVLAGRGRGGIAGIATGSLEVELVEDGPDATLLAYRAETHLRGLLATFAARRLDPQANRAAAYFFKRFATQLNA